MSSDPTYFEGFMDPFSEEEDSGHSPEPWRQEGRYVRDAAGAIVVRGKSSSDARRIVAAVNGTRGIPTEALESWFVQDVSDPETRPEFEVDVDEGSSPPPSAVSPPDAAARGGSGWGISSPAEAPATGLPYVFERRVFQRRMRQRRASHERRTLERRRESLDRAE